MIFEGIAGKAVFRWAEEGCHPDPPLLTFGKFYATMMSKNIKRRIFMNDREKDEFMEAAKFSLGYSWEVHRQAFGPILEPAFRDNPSVRIPLTAALNYISRQEIPRAKEILLSIKPQCVCNEDKAAWTFCVGLAHEMAGDTEEMMRWYARAGRYGHRFYLPYLKVAKAAYEDVRYDMAAKNFALAIECLLEAEESEKENAILASAYVNFCAVLTMMHRYDEAEQAWQAASRFPLPAASLATAAVLYAAKGDREQTETCLRALKKKLPSQYEPTKAKTDSILEGRDAHFRAIPFEKEKIDAFWKWFEKNQGELLRRFAGGADSITSPISEQIKRLCPYFTRKPRFLIQATEEGFSLTLDDFYAKTLSAGFEALLAACPKSLRKRFSFAVSHSV